MKYSCAAAYSNPRFAGLVACNGSVFSTYRRHFTCRQINVGRQEASSKL